MKSAAPSRFAITFSHSTTTMPLNAVAWRAATSMRTLYSAVVSGGSSTGRRCRAVRWALKAVAVRRRSTRLGVAARVSSAAASPKTVARDRRR